MVIQVPLSQGLFALVDEADYPKISAHKWHAFRRRTDNTFYAARSIPRDNGRRSKEFMHRVITGIPGFNDHKDGNGLNNTRANLRAATTAENCRNIRKPRHGVTSRYKGVCWHPKGQKFQATIRKDRKNHYLGLFKLEADAAWAYDRAARQMFGAFARCNFPPPPMVVST